MTRTYLILLCTLLLAGLGYAQQGTSCPRVPTSLKVHSTNGEEFVVTIDPNAPALPGQQKSADQPSATTQKFTLGVDSALPDNSPATPFAQQNTHNANDGLYQIQDDRIVLLSMSIGSCSGALIGPSMVLTAMHCIFSHDEKPVPMENVVAYLGGTDSGISAHALRAWYPTRTKSHTDPDEIFYNDFAIIELDRPVGNQVGWFGVSNPDISTGTPLFIKAFPARHAKNRPWYSEGMVKSGYDRPIDPLSRVVSFFADPFKCLYFGYAFEHTAVTYPGSSGSPVFLKRAPNEIMAVTSLGLAMDSPKQRSVASKGALVSFVREVLKQ